MPTAPAAPAPPSPLSAFPSPESERWLLQRLKLGQGLFDQEPHRISSGGGPAAAWGLADAARMMLGAHLQGGAMEGLQGLGQQRQQARQGLFNLAQNPTGTSGLPDMYLNDEAKASGTSRLRSAAQAAALSGDPAAEKFAEQSMQQQKADREYAQLAQQIEHQHAELKLQQEKEQHAESQRGFERGHTMRTEQEWVTTPVPDLGGFTHTSRHTGESWLIIPGQKPIQISKGAAPGQPSGMSGPQGAATGENGTTPPYVKLNEGQGQAALRAQTGATGLLDALGAGFPSNSAVGGTLEQMKWKAAEHGLPQLASPDDQARVASWDAVFDPVARARAGVRIPEEQMARMRLELRPNPGESWDNHVAKTRRIIESFRAEAQLLPPVKSSPILEELDRVEAMLPRSKDEYEAFNKNAVARMRAHRAGQEAPQSATVPPRAAPAGPGAPLRKPSGGKKPPLADRLRAYGYE